jgi:anthranilate synthase component 1
MAPDPRKVIKTGDSTELRGDPLAYLEQELRDYQFIQLPGIPTFTGQSSLHLCYVFRDAN